MTLSIDKVNHIQKQGIAILQDDASPERRAVLVTRAHDITAQTVNQLLEVTGGHLFVGISAARAQAFEIERMTRRYSQLAERSTDSACQMCVSVEAREGVTTGISAADRATTIRTLAAEVPHPRKIVKPGHLFPVVVRAGGVLVRNSLAEGAFDLAQICWGNAPNSDAVVFIDLLGSDGNFLSDQEQANLAREKSWSLVSLGDLVVYRLEHENLVYKIAEAKLPSHLATGLKTYIYKSKVHTGEHLALVKGEIDSSLPVLTRVQPEFTLSDVFGGHTPPSRHQLHMALQAIEANGSGVLIYLRRPTSGYLQKQVECWRRQFDAKPAAMMREYGMGAQILRDLGVRKIELLTSNPKSLGGLETFGIEIVGHRPIMT
ncbi:MAG: 3,4-dihydroxy-2-butanone-4-phosphate synthase [Bdellovibrionales bacterium]|nr:3,4-dihydroxy-2-butanone-4-phosphate synthase [Bdellovibrionales bacterium]